MADDLLYDALRAAAAHLLPDQTVEDDALRQYAGRLRSILERLRILAPGGGDDLPPAFAYDPGRRAYAGSPVLPEERFWAVTGLGSQGYGTGDRGLGTTRGRDVGAAADPSDRTAAGGRPAAGAQDPTDLSLVEQAEAVRTRQISAEELMRAVLERAERLNPQLNAFITLVPEAALAAARAADRDLAAMGPQGPLHGVPVAHKDLIFTRDVPTTAGSVILTEFAADRDAAVVRRLAAAGAITMGKTNAHQFAAGVTSESSHAGPVRNPHDLRRSPGGSSGGSGAAVAARIVALATGTDASGAIRIPAAACGIVGLKPTFGRVSKAGVLPYSWSQDHVGPLARTVADAALALRVLAGPDPDDPAAVGVPPADYPTLVRRALAAGLGGLRVGVLWAWVEERVDPGVRKALEQAAELLAAAGAVVEPAVFLPPEVVTLVNRVIALAEAGAYHAPWLARRRDGYLPDVREQLELGQFILARDYLLAQRLRTEIARRLNAVLERFHLLIVPTLPAGAPMLGQATVVWRDGEEPVADLLVRYTAPFNVTGHPAVALPLGHTHDGMPASVQLVGRPFDEGTVLSAAAVLEAAAGGRGPGAG